MHEPRGNHGSVPVRDAEDGPEGLSGATVSGPVPPGVESESEAASRAFVEEPAPTAFPGTGSLVEDGGDDGEPIAGGAEPARASARWAAARRLGAVPAAAFRGARKLPVAAARLRPRAAARAEEERTAPGGAWNIRFKIAVVLSFLVLVSAVVANRMNRGGAAEQAAEGEKSPPLAIENDGPARRQVAGSSLPTPVDPDPALPPMPKGPADTPKPSEPILVRDEEPGSLGSDLLPAPASDPVLMTSASSYEPAGPDAEEVATLPAPATNPPLPDSEEPALPSPAAGPDALAVTAGVEPVDPPPFSLLTPPGGEDLPAAAGDAPGPEGLSAGGAEPPAPAPFMAPVPTDPPPPDPAAGSPPEGLATLDGGADPMAPESVGLEPVNPTAPESVGLEPADPTAPESVGLEPVNPFDLAPPVDAPPPSVAADATTEPLAAPPAGPTAPGELHLDPPPASPATGTGTAPVAYGQAFDPPAPPGRSEIDDRQGPTARAPADRPSPIGDASGLDPAEVVGGRIEPLTHVVRRSENFYSIAKYYYGSGRYYRALWAANRDRVPRIDELYVGTPILVPAPEDLDRGLIEPPGAARPVAGPSPEIEARPPRPRDTTLARRDDRAERTLRTTAPARADDDRPAPIASPRRGEIAEERPLDLPRAETTPGTGTRMARGDEPAPAEPPVRRGPARVYTVRGEFQTARSVARDLNLGADDERAFYELNREAIGSPGAYLQPGIRLRVPESVIRR